MLGAIASFVGYGLGGELASKGIQKLGRYSLSAGFKALNSLKSSGAGVRAIITHAAKTRAASGFRQVFNSTKKLAFDELQAKSHHVQENFTKRLVSGYNRRINVVARKFGGKKAFTRRIVRDAIRGEAKFLPINYAMYKHEQYTGAIDPESGFGKYYLTQWLPMGIAFSAGLDAGKRALKVAGHRSFKGNRAAVFGMEAIVKLGAESLHTLNATTKGMFAVYDNSVSKLMAANATFGAFRGTGAAIREITHVANTTSTRRARRDDFFRYKANKADYDSHLDEKLTNSYKEAMGDMRHDIDSSRRRLMPIDSFSLENTELKRAGWNKKINSYHGKLRELAGMRSTGDEIGYTTSRRRTSVDIYSEKDGQINLRREDKYLTQDRGKMDILGSQYDFGNFHIDAIRDSLNKIATQTLNIANRPWLNFLDGGNNWLMSKKTKMLQFGLKRGQGVVGAGFKSTTRVSIAASPDPEISKLIGEGQFEEAAHLGIKNIFGATDEQATMYLNTKRNKAIEALSRQPNSSATTADLHEKVTEDIAKRMRFGEVEFGTGDVLDIIGGKAHLHTNIGGFGYTTFKLQHAGVELTGTSLLRGDTRAGQLAGSVLGGRHNVDSVYGNEISVGVESSETIKHTDYYKTDHWFARIASVLELGGGQEQSLLGKMRTMYTKWSDPSYIGMHVSNIKRGILDRNSLDQAMSKNTLNAHSTIEMAKAYGNYADHGVREVYSYIKAASMANASHTPEMDFPAIYSRIKTAIQDAPGLDPKYGQFLNDFDPLKMVIGTNDSSSVIKNKIQHLRKLREKHEGISDILGLDVTAADELQEILSTSGTGNVHSALGRIKNRISPIDKVNRNIFETLISVAHAGDRVDPSVGHVLSVVATEGRALAQRGGLNENQVSPSGILNMLHLRKNANHFMSGKETKIDERQLNYFKSDILEMNDHYGEFGLVESMVSHGGKKRLREAASAENHFILLSENNWSTKGLDTAGFRTLPIGRGEVEQLAAVNTMNSALALLGLGFNIGNKTVTIGDIVQKTMLKRVVPFIGLMAANDFAMGVAQNTPGLQDTSLAGGITGAAWDAYAGARVLGQTVSDFTGMTSVAKYVEGLMPGTIDSPLSGLVRGMLPIAMGLKLGSGSRLGATRGGLIGTGIGMLLGGGPLGLFGDWNIAKGREEVIQELSGEKETEVRKGRFWEMCQFGECLVYVENKGFKFIKDIIIGEKILTHNGNIATVGGISNRKDIKSYKMISDGNWAEEIRGTAEHPMLIYRDNEIQWIENQNILLTDKITYPIRSGTLNYIYIHTFFDKDKPTLTFSQDGKTYYQRLQKTKNNLFCKSSSKPIKVGQNGVLNITRELGLIIGHFLGDGNIFRGKDGKADGIELAFDEPELSKAAEFIIAFEKIFGITGEIENVTGTRMLRIRYFNGLIGEIFEGLFQGSLKIIPDWMYSCKSISFYEGIISGLLDSDGTVSGPNIIFTNTNLQIVHLLWFAALKLNIFGRILLSKTAERNGHQRQYNLSFRALASLALQKKVLFLKASRLKVRGFNLNEISINSTSHGTASLVSKDGIDYIVTNIKTLEIIENDELFYDIKVDHEDHSFTGFSVSYHNSGGSFFGNKTTYFRPHQYALQKMQYQRGSNYIGNDPVDELTSYIDPSVYARKHYLSRPYPEVGDIGSNMPIIGSLVGAISGPEMMHQEDMQTMADSALLSGRSGGLPSPTMDSNGMGSSIQPTSPFAMDEAGFYGGNVIGANTRNMMAPTSSGSFESVVDTTADNMLDVAGLRGFVLGSVMEGVAGSSTGFGGGMRLESGNNIASMSKLYWEKEYGGIVGLSEGIRRILPNPSTGGTEYWNELPNTQANFLPGQGSFTDFLVGDAESKVQYGEVRLPGASYELTKNIFYTYPIDASMMRRPYEEQVGFYAGDVLTLSTMRKRWHVVERTRKELVAGLKSSMEIVKERDVAYDPDNDVHAYVDAISKDPTGEKTAILVAPIDRGYLDPAGEAQLNAFLVTNTKEIHNGLLIGLDKDGNTTKQIIHADAKRYMQDLKASRQAAQSGASMTKELEDSGESVNRWPAYSHLNRLEILLNVAPFSPEAQLEMKIIKQQKETGQFGAKQKDKYYQLMDNFVKRLNSLDTDEYRFLPLLMGKTPLGTAAAKRMIETDTNYSKPEQYVGGVWEYLSHLRNPISNKLLGNRSIMEAYKQDMAIGKGFKQWTDPVSDFVLNPLEVVASEEDPVQATISGATGGFIFGGPIGAGVGALSAGLSAAMGVTTSERSSRWEQLDRVHAMADALKYKEIEQMDESEMGSERRFTLRRKSSIYYNYTQGTQEGPVGANDVVGSVNPAERSYVRRIMQNLYKEDVEGLGNLMPEYSKGLLDSYATGQAVDTSKYSSYMSQSRRVIDGAPLKFRSDDMIYKTLQNQGYQATDLSLGWKQQINRVRYIESQGNDIPDLTQDPGYPGIVPRFSTLR